MSRRGSTRRARRRVVIVATGVTALLAAGATTAVATSHAPRAARAAAAHPAAPSPLLGALTTFGYGNTRSGDDTVDPTIATLSASTKWDSTLDGAVYGQPLIYDATVYVATENDTIYALSPSSGRVLWHVHVGNAVSTEEIDTAPGLSGYCGDIDPLGITGTPVIDTATHELFAAEETTTGGQWQDIEHWLVAVSLTTHKELWHHEIDPPDPNRPTTYYIAAEQQRPALTLLDNRIYVEFGGLDGDCGLYHGYVVSLAASGTGALSSYKVPTEREGGIWGTGGAYVSPGGALYVATGNGSSNTIAQYDEGNSLVELSKSLMRVGSWAPSNWVQLNDDDWDLGSAGPLGVPGTPYLFVAGKPADGSFGYLLRTTPLEGIGKGAFTGALCTAGGVFGADATDVVGTGAARRIYVYAACGGGTEAVRVDVAARTFSRAWAPSTGAPNGSPIVAGGLVWAVNWDDAALFGMDPTTGRVLVERSTDPLEHFVAPSVGDGVLVVPTADGVEAWGTVR